MITVKFGEYLRKVRLQKGLSMDKVVEKTGNEIDKTTLSRIELGKRSLSLKCAYFLARIYDINLDDFVEMAIGRKMPPEKTHFDISPEEKKMVLNYRKLLPELKVIVKNIINNNTLQHRPCDHGITKAE